MRRAFPLVVVGVVACGGGGAAEPPASPGGPLDLTARPTGPDDLVVARVDGRPVYASCVIAQAAGRHVDRATALDDCVTFELLAGAAIARGRDRDPELAAAVRDAAAIRLIDVEVRAKIRQWGDLPAAIRDPIFEKNRERLNLPESRSSWYARVKVPKPDRGGPREQAAERAIRVLATAIGGRADLFKADLDRALPEAVNAVDPTLPYEVGRGEPTQLDCCLQDDYRRALFTTSAPGQISAPVRTPWGWDMILFDDYRVPPKLTPAELGDKLFPAARLQYWSWWTDGLAKAHEARVVDDAALRRALGEPGGSEARR